MQRLRGLTVGLNSSGRYKFKPPESVVDHLVIGGGVVGLAVARRLSQRFPDKTTFLIERHTRAGEETSSRNSEVIHAGLYYPPDSLKTKLCLRGRALLYAYCAAHNVPVRKTGKLVVARAAQTPYIARLHAKAAALSAAAPNNDTPALPTELISGARARALEPDLSQEIVAALWSPETGIVDSHALMASLEADLADTEGGAIAYATRAVRVDAAPDGWVVQAVTGGGAGDGDALLARTLVNASGLAGPRVLNALLPPARRIPAFFARGSYASYRGPGARAAHLVYPCPDSAAGKDSHAFQSLGTHLTLDMQGQVRFGPDLEWVEPEADEEGEVEFWRRHLVPDEARLGEMYRAVREYLPGVVREGMQPDYVGVRPKLVPPGGGFQDFVIRTDYSGDFVGATKGRGGPMVSLLGIESPGLTASLAIAETVVDDILARRDNVQ